MKRHIPVKGRKSLYWSERVDGTKVYECRYRDIDGRQHFKVVGPDLKEAIAEQARINVKLGKGTKAHYAPMTFGAVAEGWSEANLHRKSLGTEKKYVSIRDNYLLPEFENKKIRSITTDHVALFLSRLKTATGKQMSPSYAAGIYSVLYDIMEWASNDRRGYIPKNPCDSLERGERPVSNGRQLKRAFTKDEIQGIFQHSPEFLKPILLTGLYAGLRPSEIVGLRWDDIDFEQDKINVRFQLSTTHQYVETKGKEQREVALLTPLRVALFALPTRFGGGYVFEDEEQKMATYDHARQAFNKTRDKAGVDPKMTLHSLRHTYASSQLRNGEDVVWVSEQLGHKNPRVTLEVYAHVIQRENRNQEAAQRLNDALGELG